MIKFIKRSHLILLFRLKPFQLKEEQYYSFFHWSWNFEKCFH